MKKDSETNLFLFISNSRGLEIGDCAEQVRGIAVMDDCDSNRRRLKRENRMFSIERQVLSAMRS
ncbi:MAG: hypothetical protein JEY91_11725 [Spirochaetaceae bacterium]|nr:hypothetical protein [Spirochaetaceae bacterium]